MWSKEHSTSSHVSHARAISTQPDGLICILPSEFYIFSSFTGVSVFLSRTLTAWCLPCRIGRIFKLENCPHLPRGEVLDCCWSWRVLSDQRIADDREIWFCSPSYVPFSIRECCQLFRFLLLFHSLFLLPPRHFYLHSFQAENIWFRHDLDAPEGNEKLSFDGW